jgi:hypothetical protein
MPPIENVGAILVNSLRCAASEYIDPALPMRWIRPQQGRHTAAIVPMLGGSAVPQFRGSVVRPEGTRFRGSI